MMDHKAEKALRFVCDEIDKIVDLGELNKETLSHLSMLADIKKDFVTTKAMEESSYGGMEENGASYGRMYSRPYYSREGSYGRGRDSMGRYTSRDNGNSYYPYSRDGAEAHTHEVLQRYLNEANNEEERALIHRIMNSI